MAGLPARFLGSLHGTCRLDPRSTLIVCCVSGGVDSVALLHLSAKLRESYQTRVHALHFNHRLRGCESDEDENFVRLLCERLAVPLYVRSWDEPTNPASRGVQMKSRIWRAEETRRLLADLSHKSQAHQNTCKAIAMTAHTADDQQETILLKLTRGVHLMNLNGMSPLPESADSPPYHRPLLGFRKRELRNYLEDLGERWREDSSNKSDKYQRNRIRNELIPLLADLCGGSAALDNRLGNLTAQSSALRDHMQGLLDPLLDSAVVAKSVGVSKRFLQVTPLQSTDECVRTETLHSFIAQELSLRGCGKPVMFPIVKKLASRICEVNSATHTPCNVSIGHCFTARLLNSPHGVLMSVEEEIGRGRALEAHDSVDGLAVSHPARWHVAQGSPGTPLLAVYGAGNRITIRTPQPGDRIFAPNTPWKSLRKLTNVLRARIPASERWLSPYRPIAVCEEGLVVGVWGVPDLVQQQSPPQASIAIHGVA